MKLGKKSTRTGETADFQLKILFFCEKFKDIFKLMSAFFIILYNSCC